MVLLALTAGTAWIDMTTACSILLGGLISIGPNWYFARQAFRFRGALASPLVVRSFYFGETGKFVLTAAIFAVVFAVVRPLNAVALWLAFIGMTLSHSVMWHQLLNRVAGGGAGGKARL
jgi:ATP synthase protein I